MSHTSCLVGHICQLNYGWGGLVEHQTLGASQCSQHIYFSGSTDSLRIGQEVGFRLRQLAGMLEAVDLTPLRSQSPQAKSPLWHARFLQTQDGFPLSKLTSAIWQRQIRRLQRGILKFSNAAKAEQCKLVVEAERLLDELLGQPDLDGDSLCQLIRRCASWLHAPIFKALAGDEPSLSDGQHPMNLQCRVRKLLIRALDHLDLSDRPTFEAVEAAMLHLHTLVQQVDLKLSSRTDRSSDSARQWLKLRELVRGSSSESSFPGSVVAYHGRQGVAPPTTTLDVDFMESVTLCWITPGKQIELFST